MKNFNFRITPQIQNFLDEIYEYRPDLKGQTSRTAYEVLRLAAQKLKEINSGLPVQAEEKNSFPTSLPSREIKKAEAETDSEWD